MFSRHGFTQNDIAVLILHTGPRKSGIKGGMRPTKKLTGDGLQAEAQSGGSAL